jgi:hypothetical protein
MASQKQIRANRDNATRSTGPRTTAGKRAVRYNALRHGLLAQATVLPDEEEDEFKALIALLHDELEPASELESLLIDRIAACAWRLRRVLRVETSLFVHKEWDELAERGYRHAELFVEGGARRGATLSGQEIIDRDGYTAALLAGALAEAERDGERTKLGAAFIRDASGANALSKLSRYETAIERSFYRAVSQLQCLQEHRRISGSRELKRRSNGQTP